MRMHSICSLLLLLSHPRSAGSRPLRGGVQHRELPPSSLQKVEPSLPTLTHCLKSACASHPALR
jgi:hypothetical protein